jgi:hypothetical protein
MATDEQDARFQMIMDAFFGAVSGREITETSLQESMPAIVAAVPDVSKDEIVAALVWFRERVGQAAEQFHNLAKPSPSKRRDN